MMPNFFSFTSQQLSDKLEEMGERSFRAKQLFNWVYQKQQLNLQKMTSLSEDLRSKLADNISFKLPKIITGQVATDGTRKFLLQLQDANKIEMVLIPAAGKNTLCVSSQVGCARNCRFCATAKMGLLRNLDVAEIISQVYLAKQQLGENKLTNLVFMGMGEPLDNYENMMQAVRILQDELAFKFSPRRITISTSGVVPGIAKLAVSGVKVKLAVSLNSAIQTKREYLMPISRKYSLTKLKQTLKKFQRYNPYRITFEYVLIKGFNMGKKDIKALRAFVGDISCKLNLIPWNPIAGSEFKSPTEVELNDFMKQLMDLRVALTVRRSRGTEIDAACGQLAAGS
jgi:23S rRNA (adenine2503-C2)-methyltransferase